MLAVECERLNAIIAQKNEEIDRLNRNLNKSSLELTNLEKLSQEVERLRSILDQRNQEIEQYRANIRTLEVKI